MTDLSDSLRIARESFAAPEDTPAARADAVAPVVFEDVGKRYAAAPDAPRALDGVSFEIRAGEVFGIIGRSGAGKSTLLRTINRLEAPTEGRVLVQGTDVNRLDDDALLRLRRRTGMVFQHFNLLSAKTVWENVALPLKVAGVAPALVHARVNELLALVGLEHLRDAFPARLSGGQKQRVGIARALVHEPQILLCDEATSALDPETTQSILALLTDLRRRLSLTIVLITHEMAVIREVCDRVAVLERGRVVELDEVWRVFGDPRSDATRALLRPLARALPPDLLGGLRSGSAAGGSLGPREEAVLALDYTGATGREPDLAALADDLAGAVRLLHGGIDRIQGHGLGRLVVAVRGGLHALALLRTVASAHADRVELLGVRDVAA